MKFLGRWTCLLLAAILGWCQLPSHADGLNATYWSNPDFTGTAVTRIDPTINFDWNTGSPMSGIGADNFSVRWTGYVKPAYSQTYTFYLAADDGCRLWVNGTKLIDDWAFNYSNSERTATIALSANTFYSIKVEYLENSGWADVYLSWSSASQAKQIVPATSLFSSAPTPTPTPVPGTGTGLTGSYYNGRDFSSLIATRTDAQVNFDWGGGSPLSGVGVDNFCVRWQGQVQAPITGTYIFSTTTDDGTRLWVNNQLLVDKWVDQGATSWSGTINLTAGQSYPIKMDYYENSGGASAKLSWSGPGIASQIIPQTYLYPLPALTPSAQFGVNLEGAEQNPGTAYYDYPNTRWGGAYYTGSLDYYQARGRHVVRLPLSWERMQPTLYGALDVTQLGKLDSFLNDASARGLKVILDCHNYAKYNGQTIGSGSVDSGALADFWKRMAGHCAANFAGSSVIYGYDLMNEPQIGSAWQGVAQDSITAIRGIDTKTAIFVEGDNWSHAYTWPQVNNGLLTLNDPSKNLVFEAHEYFDPDHSGTYSGNPTTAPTPQSAIDAVSPFVNWCKTNNVRGFLGEFAIPNSTAQKPVNDDAGWDALLDGVLNYLNTNGIGGTYWAGGTRWDPSERISIEPLSIDTTSQSTIAATTDRPQMLKLKNYPG